MFFSRFIISNMFSIALIGIILAVKKLFKDKISLKFHYHIWFTLLFSLIVVFLPSSFFQSLESSGITQEITAPSVNVYDNTTIAPDMVNDWRYDFTEIVDTSDKIELNLILTILWIVGILGVIIIYSLGNKKLKTIKRFAEPASTDILTIFDKCCKSISIKHKVCLLQSDMITSPLSFGCRISYIILPSRVVKSSSEIEIEHILLHELMHISHKDIWMNLWLCIEQIVYWFNPFIWWAFAQMRRDREAYCDWSVLNIYKTDDERLCYGDTLLQFASQRNNVFVYTANSLFYNKEQIKYRIEKIANFKKETKISKSIGRCFTIVLALIIIIQVPVFAAFASDFGLSYNPKKPINTIEQNYSDLYGDALGCAVIYDTKADIYNVYNQAAITKRIAPCSTCKIYSAINALEQGILTLADNTIEWDGLSRGIPSWDKNQDLYSAMKNSVNWYFQYLDKTSGANELEEFYKKIGYGNEYIGKDTSYYWNGSALKISPLEQVDLLIKLYNNDFGFKQSNVDIIKNSLFISELNGYKIYGKTGTGKIGSNDVNGWFIGYVEAQDNTYFFAVNIQNSSNANGNTAVQITHSIFARMGIEINS